MSDNARKETEPKQAFAQIQGMSLTQEVMMGIESSKRDMREQTGALVAFNGQGDPTLTTATAMSIARDSALALISTPLAIGAEVDQKWCWQVLKLVKEYWYDQKYKFLLGKYNEAEADAFKECKLEEEINVFVEANSWMPQTNNERLQNLGAFLTAFGLPLGFLNPQIPQVVRDYAAQLYNVPFDFNELAPDIRIAQKRLDIAKENAEIQVPKAMTAMAVLLKSGNEEDKLKADAISKAAIATISDSMGIEEDLDELAVFIDQYKKWLKSDEGQNAHPILREAVKMTMNDCKVFLQTQEAEKAQNAMIMAGGQPPPTQGGQQLFQPQKPEENPFQPPAPKEGVQDFSSNAKKQQG
jgi:hypothetical protein